MTYKMGIPLATTAMQQAGLIPVLSEMYAFEQANGTRPEKLFYVYPLTTEQRRAFDQYRLIVKHGDSRVCLSWMGRKLVGSL